MANPTPKKTNYYKFKIDAYSPTRMPLNLLAEYLQDLSVLFGEQDSVHLIRIEKGSTVPVLFVEKEAEPKINKRLTLVKQKDAPADALRAAERIDERLRRDNATGHIITPSQKKIIIFPGVTKKMMIDYPPFTQYGTLDGVPISVGGELELVHIHLEGRRKETYNCDVNRTIAKQIAQHLFTTVIRVEGSGRWKRHENGEWELKTFHIKDFKPLPDASLKEETEALRAIPAEWKNSEDPLADLATIQHNETQ